MKDINSYQCREIAFVSKKGRLTRRKFKEVVGVVKEEDVRELIGELEIAINAGKAVHARMMEVAAERDAAHFQLNKSRTQAGEQFNEAAKLRKMLSDLQRLNAKKPWRWDEFLVGAGVVFSIVCMLSCLGVCI